MTNIQKMPTETMPEPRNDGAALLSIIERAAMNPEVDIEKMERLFAMHERMQAAAARTAHMAALTQMQAEIPTHIEERGGIKDRNQRVQSTYALWEDINQAIRPVLHRHGFALTFRTRQAPGSITVIGVLSHEAGHSETAEIELPHDGSGSKNAVQAVASSITYGKRYAAGELLNFTSGSDEADDDGKTAGAKTITAEQYFEMKALIEEAGVAEAKILAVANVARLDDVPPTAYPSIMKRLRKTIADKAEKGAV